MSECCNASVNVCLEHREKETLMRARKKEREEQKEREGEIEREEEGVDRQEGKNNERWMNEDVGT